MARSPSRQALADLIAGRQATVAVVGLGYVGLPLAVAVAEAGFHVIGIDRDAEKVRALQGGRSYVEDVEAGDIERLVAQKRLHFCTDGEAATPASVALIAVPTPIDETQLPDLRFVRDAAQRVAGIVRPPAVVILESTVYPGATEEILAPVFEARGWIPGRDIFLGYSPERIDPGNELWRIGNTPKIIAGLTADCLDVAVAFYATFVTRLVPVSNIRTAETAKLFENTFRMVNIALVNEFKVICDAFGIDAWEALGACKTKPYGFMPFQPGPGLGGHCIPVDPFYLAWKAREKQVPTEFIELAGRINGAMPAYVVGQAAALLNAQGRALNGSRVALLGAAYKRNSSDVRESPAIRVAQLLLNAGAIVTYHDPHVPSLRVDSVELRSEAWAPEYLSGQDCIIVITDHDAIDWTQMVPYAHKVVDTRNALGRLQPSPIVGTMQAAERSLAIARHGVAFERESA